MINTEDKQLYVSPRVKTIEFNAHGIICQSGNEPMEERDNGQYGEW